MTHIRQWVLAAIVAALLTLSFSVVASADPGDPHGGFSSGSAYASSSLDPGDPSGGW
jgi:hypothetical protein